MQVCIFCLEILVETKVYVEKKSRNPGFSFVKKVRNYNLPEIEGSIYLE